FYNTGFSCLNISFLLTSLFRVIFQGLFCMIATKREMHYTHGCTYGHPKSILALYPILSLVYLAIK
ncbi:hypothetical protein CLU79DRAFT_765457, partial [Phycomyces nitens]